MRRIMAVSAFAVVICVFLSGCVGSNGSSASGSDLDPAAVSDDGGNMQETEDTESSVEDTNVQEPAEETMQEEEEQTAEDGKMYIRIGEYTLTATMAENSSAQALLEKLREGDITINAHDFGNFEKVGELGFSLPSNNEQITTEAGDLILYQGSNFVLYYDTNSWNFTRLGKVEGVTREELRDMLGEGDVTMVLSLNN